MPEGEKNKAKKGKGDCMDFEEFYKRLEERGLPISVFKQNYEILKVQPIDKDDEDNQRRFDVCNDIIRACCYLDVIDGCEYISLSDRLASYFHADFYDCYGD